jgi:hypothetical protein
VDNAHGTFKTLGVQISNVTRGEHREGLYLMFVSLVVTGAFISLILAHMASRVTGIELVALLAYFVVFIGSLEQYSVAVSTLRTGVVE